MTREKKKLTYKELEEHTIYWGVDRLEDLRQVADKIYLDQSLIDEQKEAIYDGIAQQILLLIELIHPLPHDEEHLMLWAAEFVHEYATYN